MYFHSPLRYVSFLRKPPARKLRCGRQTNLRSFSFGGRPLHASRAPGHPGVELAAAVRTLPELPRGREVGAHVGAHRLRPARVELVPGEVADRAFEPIGVDLQRAQRKQRRSAVTQQNEQSRQSAPHSFWYARALWLVVKYTRLPNRLPEPTHQRAELCASFAGCVSVWRVGEKGWR